MSISASPTSKAFNAQIDIKNPKRTTIERGKPGLVFLEIVSGHQSLQVIIEVWM